jgi:hypothetical protein
MDGPDIIGDYWYGRGRSMLAPGDIVKIIDYEGNASVFKLGVRESISGMSAVFAGDTATVTAGIAAGAASQFADFKFTEPGQENRLFHFRPVVIAVVKGSDHVLPGRILFPPIPDNVFVPITPVAAGPPSFDIPMGVSLQLKQPGGKWRWGTDLKRDVPVTTPGGVLIPNVGIGGADGGFLEAPLIPFLADMDELYDIFTIYGQIIQIRLVNRTDFFWPPGYPVGAATDDKNLFVVLVGEKFILHEVSEEIVRKVEDREIDYQPIVIGGVPQVTGKA